MTPVAEQYYEATNPLVAGMLAKKFPERTEWVGGLPMMHQKLTNGKVRFYWRFRGFKAMREFVRDEYEATELVEIHNLQVHFVDQMKQLRTTDENI